MLSFDQIKTEICCQVIPNYLRILGQCDSKQTAHDSTIEFIKILSGHLLDGSFLYDPSVPQKIEESKEPQNFHTLKKPNSDFTAEIAQTAQNYEEAVDVAEAKLDSWDTFFEQKQVELVEVQQRMSAIEIKTDDKVVSPQASINQFYETQRSDLKKAKDDIMKSKKQVKDQVKKIFDHGMAQLTGKEGLAKKTNLKTRMSADYLPNVKQH